MFEHYRKTFLATQLTTLIMTVWVFLSFHRMWWFATAVFLTMQASALVGAAWGARLRRRLRTYG